MNRISERVHVSRRRAPAREFPRRKAGWFEDMTAGFLSANWSLIGRWVVGTAGALLLAWGIHKRGVLGASGIFSGVVFLHWSLAVRARSRAG